MEIEGHIYYDGKMYDDNGHCDDYDLMFRRADNGEEICLNGFEDAVLPEGYNKENKSFMSPISVHDIIRGKLTINFEKREVEENAIL